MSGKRPGIYGFTGPYRFLSNFYLEPDGTHVEGEYQRAKCLHAKDRKAFYIGGDETVGVLKPPAQCKAIGRRVTLRLDWELVKDDIMLHYVTKKFKDHPRLADLLRQTSAPHTRYLEETNHWGDTYWGVCNGYGLNMLGAILMQVRDEAWTWPSPPLSHLEQLERDGDA